VAEATTNSRDTLPTESEGVLTAEQRGLFRSAALWMTMMGWIEVAVGVLIGALGLLSWWRVVPPEEVFPTTFDRATVWIQAAFTISIGVLTLLAARSFRRASKDSENGLGAVIEAVTRLRELYERQVLFVVVLLIVFVALAFFAR
jgi:hypothetical protein